ncbi:hypothetical protein VKT23_013864 [Stygiomarasmius scandens]|uniref:Uncharacterized protein n=1 Tax=Marasmiellus scandens TaxID=2682957 RepID=A0ABR1J226_9AGAR
MYSSNRPRTAFASTEPFVHGSGTASSSSGRSDYEYIPNLQQPRPVRSSTMAPVLSQPAASTTWDYLRDGSFVAPTSPSSQRTIVTPHIASQTALPPSPSCAVSSSASSIFPSLSPLLDTLQSPFTPVSTYSTTRTHSDLVSLPTHHSSPLTSPNPYVPFLDPHPSVRYDYNTVYTPPPIPTTARDSLLSPLGINLENQRGDDATTVNLNDDIHLQSLRFLAILIRHLYQVFER